MRAEPTPDDMCRFATTLPAWVYDAKRRALHRRLRFASFGEALAAMVRIGVEADKADHHPEWTNIYDTVDIWLTTHDAGGVSPQAETLAALIEAMFPELAG